MFSVMASRFPRQILRHRAALAKPVEHLGRLILACFLPQASQKALTRQAKPGSPRPQKYTCETFKEKMKLKVPSPKLWEKRSQRQTSGQSLGMCLATLDGAERASPVPASTEVVDWTSQRLREARRRVP